MVEVRSSRRHAPTAEVRQDNVLTISQDLPTDLGLEVGDRFLVRKVAEGYLFVDARSIPLDQAWFWTPEWQEGEREAEEQMARGEGQFFGSSEEFLQGLANLAGVEANGL